MIRWKAEKEGQLKGDFDMKRLENWGNHESSDKNRNNVNSFHLKLENTMTLPQSGTTIKKTSASGRLCLKSYIQFWRLRIDNVLGGNRYAYR